MPECTGAFPCETVSTYSDLWEVTHHGIPAMGWILTGILIIGGIALLLAETAGTAMKLKVPHFGIPIGLVFIFYGLHPPFTAVAFLVTGTGIIGVFAGRWVWDIRKELP